jgi:hypothetical protein
MSTVESTLRGMAAAGGGPATWPDPGVRAG